MSVYRNEEAPFSVAVNPSAYGVQFVTVLASADAPEIYTYQFDATDGLATVLTDDGGAAVVDPETHEVVAAIEKPWAVDASGNDVPTRFELTGTKGLTQVVDHQGAGFDYPIAADPKVKACNYYTAVCVKLSKAETKRGHDALFVSVAAAVGTLCGMIPSSNPYTIAAKAICAAAVAGYFFSLRAVFKTAKSKGKCVELKYRIVGPAIVTGKVVTC